MDGKTNKNVTSSTDHSLENVRGLPNYNYKKQKLNFVRSKTLAAGQSEPMVSSVMSSIIRMLLSQCDISYSVHKICLCVPLTPFPTNIISWFVFFCF